MIARRTQDIGEIRRLVSDLRSLGAVAAPQSLLPGVLAQTGAVDRYATIDTPLGQAYVAFSRHGVSQVSRVVDVAGGSAAFEQGFLARTGRAIQPADALPSDLARAVERRLAGERRSGLRFDLRGLSEFEQSVLLKALEIPRGEVRPYGWIAGEIGRPGAVRAVGSALGRNPVPILIPCHRVVRTDGRVGEYALGSPAKRTILEAEGAAPDFLDQLAREGVRFYGSDTTRIYCFPTCRHARRVTDRHQQRFPSRDAALAAGYRACKVCRPGGGAIMGQALASQSYGSV